MVIDMRDAKQETFEHFKGGEKQMDAAMFFDGSNRIIFGKLEPGATVGYHRHEGNCEIIYIISGKARYLMDDGVEYAVEGQCHYCPEGHSHSMINEGPDDLVFFAVVPKQ